MNLVEQATKLSFKNKKSLTKEASCYFCLTYCSISDIIEWVDKGETAICPHCSVDSLLPGIIDRDTLISIHNRWFKPCP